ncbi:hypothetical protein [Streptosporangium sp. NPDC002721]|uniref:hypothetical protein n=1 Tax=Streptosporangium sp. NPDC002721 TaxID=3366188 RepID=UPI0036A67F24
MFKHALTAGTLVASGLIVAMAMSVQPAGANATPQEAASASVLLSDPSPGGHHQHYDFSPGHHHHHVSPGHHHHHVSPGHHHYWPGIPF